ncbi:hypothetical protein Mal52_18900 [Symmachiella dynata]|uniref:Uncharacterized protein n=1 Tax=Symmachiella dynata TaxID=2527995 RepID=A0A517ZLR8_9PLAN|nr:hypothetical protein [Symmachiella dynata]QDU43416.1 hypothetical protein Mal52_18900 [Symmachiella dynata]
MTEKLNILTDEEQQQQGEQKPNERCRNLLCKGLYLNYGLAERVTGDGNFWCGKTQATYGPDDQLVGDGECRHTGRGCYESL